MKDYDIVIVGAGCSGLSLAYRLINSSYSVCVIENKPITNRIRKNCRQSRRSCDSLFFKVRLCSAVVGLAQQGMATGCSKARPRQIPP